MQGNGIAGATKASAGVSGQHHLLNKCKKTFSMNEGMDMTLVLLLPCRNRGSARWQYRPCIDIARLRLITGRNAVNPAFCQIPLAIFRHLLCGECSARTEHTKGPRWSVP